ncbi:MAG: substrate-binding domain-containing protein [Spirochaetaceae bacterium]|nr:MAG: substrate-binding domain-containing protein [Spirochaetaceae bacterium]
MKRIVLVVLAVLVTTSLLYAAPKKEEGKLTFAYMSGIEDPFMRMIEKGAQAKAEELGVEIMTAEYPKAWGPDIQVPILEALSARGGFDFLIVVPTGVEALIAPLKKIHDKGIPMITTDTFLGDGDYSKPSSYSFPLAYIGTDNELGGYEVGKRLAEMIGKTGKVYINTTNPDVSSVTGRRDGFLRAMKEFPNIKVVGIDYNLDNQETAQRQTAALLQANPDLKGIFGTNLFSAQGAYQAVVNAGLTGAVKIASWDATVDLIEALKAGKVDLVLAQKPYEIGYLAVEWGYKYLTEGAEVPKRVVPGFFFFTRENVNAPDSQQYIYK